MSMLSRHLAQYAPAVIVKDSPAEIYTVLLKEMIPGVVLAYEKALRIVFLVGVPVGELFHSRFYVLLLLEADCMCCSGAGPPRGAEYQEY